MDRTPASTVMAMQIALGTIPFGTDRRRAGHLRHPRPVRRGRRHHAGHGRQLPVLGRGLHGRRERAAIGALAGRPGNRDQVVLSTKVGARPTVPGDRTLDTAEGLSAAADRHGRRGQPAPAGHRPRRRVLGAHRGPLRPPGGDPGRLRRAGPGRQGPRARAPATCPPGAWSGPGTSRPRTAGRPTPTCSSATPTCAPRPDTRPPEAGHTLATDDTLDYVRGARPDAVGVQHADVRRLHPRGPPDRGDLRPPGHHAAARRTARGGAGAGRDRRTRWCWPG